MVDYCYRCLEEGRRTVLLWNEERGFYYCPKHGRRAGLVPEENLRYEEERIRGEKIKALPRARDDVSKARDLYLAGRIRESAELLRSYGRLPLEIERFHAEWAKKRAEIELRGRERAEREWPKRPRIRRFWDRIRGKGPPRPPPTIPVYPRRPPELPEARRLALPAPRMSANEMAKEAFMRGERLNAGRILRHAGYDANRIDRLFAMWAREMAEAEATPAPPIEEAPPTPPPCTHEKLEPTNKVALDGSPIYRCQSCGKRGTLDELRSEVERTRREEAERVSRRERGMLTREEYLEEINRLRGMHRRGEINEEYLRRQMHTLMERYHGREAAEKARGAAARIGARRTPVAGPVGRWFAGFGTPLGMVSILAIFIGLGVYISVVFNSTWFLIAFFGLGIYFALPDPKSYSVNVTQATPFTWGYLNPFGAGGRHSGLAIIKSMAKVSAILGFAFGLQGAPISALSPIGYRPIAEITGFPLSNLAYMLVVFIGYFWLKGTYNPQVPSEFIEGIFRFLIGAIFIPFYVFQRIFDSWQMTIMAIAFFAVPPRPSSTAPQMLSPGMGATYAYYDMMEKFVFAILMLVALGGTYIWGWELRSLGALGTVFIYFWFITAVAGFFSPPETRPITGIIMLGITVLIFGSVFGQELGKILFGVWWPQIHNTADTILKPIGDAFGQLGQTFGQAIFLITNPIGYAQQIMSGTYEPPPQGGPAGPLGVKIEGFSVETIYPPDPFFINLNLRNAGAFKAKNIIVNITAPEHFKITDTEGGRNYGDNCWITDAEGELLEKDVKPYVFTGQISCETIEENKELRKEYVTITTEISYNYEVNSWLPVEFITQTEREKRAREGTFAPAPVPSHISTAPVKLNIDTAPDQPIVAGRDFYIRFNLTPEEPNSKIDEKSIKVQIGDFSDFESMTITCNPSPTGHENGIYKWERGLERSERVVCKLKLPENKIAEDSKTYFITANATYNFSKWETKDTLFAFKTTCKKEVEGA